MKSLLSIPTLVFLQIGLLGATVSDSDDLLSEQEIKQLENRCSKIHSDHRVNIQLHFYSDALDEPQFSAAKQGKIPLVFVSVNRADTLVTVKCANLNATRTRFFENAFFQFLNVPLKEGAPTVRSVNATLDQMEKELIRRQQSLEQRSIEDEQLDRLDPRAVILLWTFFWIMVVFGIYFLVRNTRIKNKNEARSFYGVSRLPAWFSILLGLIVLVGGSYLILNFVSYGGWLTIVVFWFAFLPIMAMLTFLISVLVDLFDLGEYDSEDVKPTLGQMLWLVRPSANTEHLMELTFYELVIRKKINLEIDTEEINHRRANEYYVSHGRNFNLKEKFRIDENAFFEELMEEKEPLEPYLHRIYALHGNFLSYRKDQVFRALFRSGLLSKFGYLINAPLLTSKGKALRGQLLKAQEKQTQLIASGIRNPSGIPDILPKLTPHVLLIKDFEKQLTHFYNVLIEIELLDQAMALPIGFLFHPDFSLRTFNLKLRSAYASHGCQRRVG